MGCLEDICLLVPFWSLLIGLKQICIAVCNKWVPPAFCKLDGERALCEAAKTFGPQTRRLVEKWHARRNIERDVTDALDGDMEQVILIMSLYEKLVEANSKLDAGIVIEQIQNKNTNNNRNNIINNSMSEKVFT